MAKHTKVTLFKTEPRHAETLMDKISRAAMEIVDDETEQRELKTKRLRIARLEREASGADKGPEAPAKGARKTPRAKTVKTS